MNAPPSRSSARLKLQTTSTPGSSDEVRSTAPQPCTIASKVLTSTRASVYSRARKAPYRELGTTGHKGWPTIPKLPWQ